MTTQQPEWELVGTLGDVDPLGYGGGWIFRDKTGVYPPELEYVEPTIQHENTGTVMVYRLILEPHTYVDGVLSDNSYHPETPVWYADKLDSVCSCCDCDRDELIAALCGSEPVAKATAYENLAAYWGWHEFDQYPLELTPEEAEERYSADKYQAKA